MEITIIKGEGIRESIYNKKLENGLEIFYMPKKGFFKKYAIFATHFGSNDLKFRSNKTEEMIEVPPGIAHFLEHKMFDEPDGNAFDRFAALGANANAYTDFQITAYHFTSTDHFYENLKNLIEFVQSPYFTDESVNKEKGIITQEIKMYNDSPEWRVFFNVLKGMYHEHPVRIDIAGTLESINQITKEDLYNCYNTFYHPGNMALFIAGDLDQEKVFHIVEDFYSTKGNIGTVDILRYYPEEITTIYTPFVEDQLSVPTPIFNIGYKDIDVGKDGQDLARKEAEMKILLDLLFGRSSDLFEVLYDKGLVDHTFHVDYIGEVNYGHTILSGESWEPKEVCNRINEALLNLKKKGLSREDFERIKRKLIGEHLSSLNSIEFIGSAYVRSFFKNFHFLEYIDILKGITFEGVEERFSKHFDENRQVLSIVRS